MRCHACSRLLPIEVSEFYDEHTDRFYCDLCNLWIMEFFHMMYTPDPEPKVDDFLEDGEVENLEEDFDDYDFYDGHYEDDTESLED